MGERIGENTMFLKRATELANFLTGISRSAEEIAKFLVLKSFADFSPTALYIAQITDDGYVSPVAGFGFEKLTIASWGRFPLSMHIPITDAVRTDRCIVIDNIDDFFGNYPILNEIENISTDWEAVLAWPMLPFGVGFALLEKIPSLDDEFENYLRLTGAVIALHLLRVKEGHQIPEFQRSLEKKVAPTTMSNRQKVILEMLSKGATNSEIAREIGYSESLVRQETIEIYQILGVNGRKELITAAGEK
jgi:DNA-binding CsgD family transcriptional regulator